MNGLVSLEVCLDWMALLSHIGSIFFLGGGGVQSFSSLLSVECPCYWKAPLPLPHQTPSPNVSSACQVVTTRGNSPPPTATTGLLRGSLQCFGTRTNHLTARLLRFLTLEPWVFVKPNGWKGSPLFVVLRTSPHVACPVPGLFACWCSDQAAFSCFHPVELNVLFHVVCRNRLGQDSVTTAMESRADLVDVITTTVSTTTAFPHILTTRINNPCNDSALLTTILTVCYSHKILVDRGGGGRENKNIFWSRHFNITYLATKLLKGWGILCLLLCQGGVSHW